jgi:ABC-2 type transport system permease protein
VSADTTGDVPGTDPTAEGPTGASGRPEPAGPGAGATPDHDVPGHDAPGHDAPGPVRSGSFVPAPAPAPAPLRALAQAAFDTRVHLANGEQVLLTVILPALALIILTETHVPALGSGRRVDLAVPGVLALAILSTAFTGQAIGTAFDRRHGVLRLLAVTPLGRTGLLAGRVLAVLGLELLQLGLLGGLGLALGWHPDPAGLPTAVLAGLLGTTAFVALGLLLAGTVRAEAVLALANLIWVLLLVGGGVLIPPDLLGRFGALAGYLPSGALADVLREALGSGGTDGPALLVLAGWAVVGTAAAARWFRWD